MGHFTVKEIQQMLGCCRRKAEDIHAAWTCEDYEVRQ